METQRTPLEGFSAIRILATLSVVALVGIGLSRGYHALVDGDQLSVMNPPAPSLPEHATTPYESIDWQASLPGNASTTVESLGTVDEDGIGNIAGTVVDALVGSYAALAEAGVYTPKEGEKIAEDIAASLRANVSYETYEAADLKTDPNISYDRMLAYRSNLRVALEPLLKNPGYELSLFATYVETRDSKYIDLLKTASKNYREAVSNAAKVVVPRDAVSAHVGILNALSEFGATVETMANHGDDAFASAALLQTYTKNEARLFASFESLASYYRNKKS